MSDFISILQWWFLLFLIGIVFLPLTTIIFSHFFDRGYIFSKILGSAFISYAVFILGIFKILPFTTPTILLTTIFFTGVNILVLKKYLKLTMKQFNNKIIRIFLFEEFLFFIALLFWSIIRGFQPDVHGLEKYMDFGFINSILRSEYFPPKDMWFTPLSINYYYFGHLVTAVLTKLSGISSSITFNLMLGTIFAFTFTSTFSIGANLFYNLASNKKNNVYIKTFLAGFITAIITTFGGNLHAIYTYFKPYPNENPVPFWQLPLSFDTFPNSYWYPNATRFIHNTIHEFPLYSFVVSDLHGHVLDIPFVFLTIALLFSLLLHKSKNLKFNIILLGFLLAIMYMTNAWDGIIYAILALIIFMYLAYRSKNYMLFAKRYLFIIVGFFIFSLPFTIHFKPFVSGIGLLCSPEFLTKTGRLGAFLFEADHCQKSPLWQLFILYGFFYFWVISFFIFVIKNIKLKFKNFTTSDIFVFLLIIISTILIIIPEFIYVKDIYPAHYRANTMFKLVYQSFMMLSICSGYIIIRLLSNFKTNIFNSKLYNWQWRFGYWIIGCVGLFLIIIYPYFAITSYYGNLSAYYGIDGTTYLKKLYPTDYKAILWLNKNVKGQPIILEAQGDSYTDYARVSSNTGLPTVLGWTVHEWLWRGTYDIPSPRIDEVKNLYESNGLNLTKKLIKKYNISLVFIGDLERQKYPMLNIIKFKNLGKIIYKNGQTEIYQLNLPI